MGQLQHRSALCSHTFSITGLRKRYLLVPSSAQSTQTYIATGILPEFGLRSYYLNTHLGCDFMSQMLISDQSYWQKVKVQIAVSFSSNCGPNSKTRPPNSLCPSAELATPFCLPHTNNIVSEESWFIQGTAGPQRPIYLLYPQCANPLILAQPTMVLIKTLRTLFQPPQPAAQ